VSAFAPEKGFIALVYKPTIMQGTLFEETILLSETEVIVKGLMVVLD
jgi:hypothetical protein